MTLVALIVLGVGAATAFALTAFQDNLLYFYSPSDVSAGKAPADRVFRVGGMVRHIERQPDGISIRFTIGDNSAHTIQARFTGITPELFREGGGVIADGRFQADGTFTATEILAKHDENYMPPELTERGMHKTDRVR